MKRDYIEFQDRSVAKAYLITFRCYGTWLHGDERGSVDRRYFNRFGTPKIAPDAEKVSRKTTQLKSAPFILRAAARRVVKNAIKEVCRIRGYGMYALHVRTNHVHIVVTNSGTPERMMDAFKAYATKALRNRRPSFFRWKGMESAWKYAISLDGAAYFGCGGVCGEWSRE